MIPQIEQHRQELIDLCRRYRVERLYLFGSAAEGRFNPHTSDLDFLVSLVDRAPSGQYAARYLELAEALERLFQRPVDLVTEQSIRNPYFRRQVLRSRQLIYERPSEEAAI